jgi:hypothetical protein
MSRKNEYKLQVFFVLGMKRVWHSDCFYQQQLRHALQWQHITRLGG